MTREKAIGIAFGNINPISNEVMADFSPQKTKVRMKYLTFHGKSTQFISPSYQLLVLELRKKQRSFEALATFECSPLRKSFFFLKSLPFFIWLASFPEEIFLWGCGGGVIQCWVGHRHHHHHSWRHHSTRMAEILIYTFHVQPLFSTWL